MSGKEWLRLCLIAAETSACWASAMWPKIMIQGRMQDNVFAILPAVLIGLGLVAWAIVGMVNTWDG